MNVIKKVDKCNIRVFDKKEYKYILIEFGKNIELGSAWSENQLYPNLFFTCNTCKSENSINLLQSAFSLRLKDISSYEFLKYISEKLNLVFVEKDAETVYCKFQYDSIYEGKNRLRTPFVYYCKCEYCGSQYLCFLVFYGGDQDRCPVTITVHSIWHVKFDEDFIKKFLLKKNA